MLPPIKKVRQKEGLGLTEGVSNIFGGIVLTTTPHMVCVTLVVFDGDRSNRMCRLIGLGKPLVTCHLDIDICNIDQIGVPLYVVGESTRKELRDIIGVTMDAEPFHAFVPINEFLGLSHRSQLNGFDTGTVQRLPLGRFLGFDK